MSHHLCPTCGCVQACYHDERVWDEITVIPEDMMDAALKALSKYGGIILRPETDGITRRLVEDVHRAMHGREPLNRREDRDFTESGLERWK